MQKNIGDCDLLKAKKGVGKNPSLNLWQFLLSKRLKKSEILLSHVWLFTTLRTVATRLLCPWDFPGKNTEAGCHALL